MKQYIIYHDKCTDGLTSAAIFNYWIEKHSYRNAHDYEFIPGYFQMKKEDLEKLKDGVVFFLDFSLKKDLFEYVLDIANNVVLIDHHKGAYDELNHLFNRSNLKVVFDLEECGSTLTWKYLFSNVEVPLIIKHVRDRDIWKWENKNSKAYLASLDMNPFALESFISFYSTFFPMTDEDKAKQYNGMVETGKTLLLQKENMVRVILDNVRYINYLGYENVAVCNCNFLFTNDVSENLIDNGTVNILITYQDSFEGRKFSIRSRDGFDSISIAKSLDVKGGGHPKASGAFISYSLLLEHPLTKSLYTQLENK